MPFVSAQVQRVSGGLEDATEYQNEVAKDSYPGNVWRDLGDLCKPRYDRNQDQDYRKPERPLGRRVQIHDILPSDDQCLIPATLGEIAPLVTTESTYAQK